MDINELNGIKVGDIITTYYKGFFKLQRIEQKFMTEELRRYGPYKDVEVGAWYGSMFHFTQVADVDGKPKVSKVLKQCDSAHCRLAIPQLTERIELLSTLLFNIHNGKY